MRESRRGKLWNEEGKNTQYEILYGNFIDGKS